MGRDWVFSPAHVPRAQKAPTPRPHPLHPTIARGAPLSSASKSWRQIAPTPIASWSVDPHDHQRAFRQALRQDLRCPLHQKYPCGRAWARVLRPVPLSKLCGLVPCPLSQPLLSALLPFLWPACCRAWNDRLGPHSGE
jgi:hypothetical protein